MYPNVDTSWHMRMTRTHHNSLQHTAADCNTLQHTATHCNTLHHTATHCNSLQNTQRCALKDITSLGMLTLQHTATNCNTLQLTATHCNTLQHTEHTATHFNTRVNASCYKYGCIMAQKNDYNTSQRIATQRNALQDTAIHCNTLQHTPTHA